MAQADGRRGDWALLPAWARRADQLRAELRSERFPPTGSAGVRIVAELSAACLNQFAGSLRGEPLARALARMSAADHARRPLWKRRRGRALGR